MSSEVLRLFPLPSAHLPLKGLYLSLRLHETGGDEPFVYADFVSSLDGRIAVTDTRSGESHLPETLTSASDFRLLSELQAQADCVITHSGYMRAIAEGRLDDILHVGTAPGTEDLLEWRLHNGLSAQPAVCIASGSLDFSLPASLVGADHPVFIATGADSDAARRRRFTDLGYEILIAGPQREVSGGTLVRLLAERGFRRIFLLAGPRMLETMLREGVLSRAFVTLSHQLFGGEQFHTMVHGPELGVQGKLKLRRLYLDAHSVKDSGQFFAEFEPSTPATTEAVTDRA